MALTADVTVLLSADGRLARAKRRRGHLGGHLGSHLGGEQGTAMVEAAFMFPMFIIMWFSIVYAHAFSATEIDTNTQSRELAWNDAMGNCNKTGDSEKETLPGNLGSLSSSAGNWQSTSSSTPTVTNTSDLAQKLSGTASSSSAHDATKAAIAGGSLEGAFGALLNPILTAVASILPDPEGEQAIARANVSWRMPNNYNGMDPTNSTPIRQTTTVPCNLAPLNGGLSGLFNEVKGAVGGP